MLGPDHPTTLFAAAALAVALLRLGEAEPAHALGRDTLQRCRRVLGPDHPIMSYLTQAASGRHPTPGDDAAEHGPDRPL